MDELEKHKSKRGGRKIHENFKEPSLFKDVESVLQTAKDKGLYEGSVLDIEALVEVLPDVKLTYSEMSGGLSGSLENYDGIWHMKINSKHHKNRQRFTIAHELGHYFLHKEKNTSFEDTTFFRGAKINPIEFAANEFASAILMPEDLIKELISEGIRELGELAEEFGVSASAMKYRLEKLGYILN
ncbi:ImmA/IrrE family metallo-endopeptidase [Myroides odoratimimus]|uniref:ImmA/IrrE family metallo-endopeptidase n=1 Tax=Myroides odoratimimus TaxID=76832 RepID=UPI002DBDAA58|nr:ImmA/IrrE family metallo-endopeptidase [Myroides odoratimimus]MEC4094016.1 ImmA/IrrE family metallo-endopeptidase [Myroides odoratimimus]